MRFYGKLWDVVGFNPCWLMILLGSIRYYSIHWGDFWSMILSSPWTKMKTVQKSFSRGDLLWFVSYTSSNAFLLWLVSYFSPTIYSFWHWNLFLSYRNSPGTFVIDYGFHLNLRPQPSVLVPINVTLRPPLLRIGGQPLELGNSSNTEK